MSAKNSKDKAPVTGKELLALVYSRLKMHNALGMDMYPANSDLQRFFSLTEENAQRIQKAGTSTEIKSSQRTEKAQGDPDRALRRINEEIADCALCLLHKEKSGYVCGSGSGSSGLMVIGDWSEQKKEAFVSNIHFGPEEDAMLWKMMGAIGLQPEEIYVTNCLKCCPGGISSPNSTSGKSCFSFLEREIALIRPRVICAMGEIAYGLLTGKSDPLARQRGKFVRYRYKSEREILVMPTYHPRFLIRHQEMKKATWLDLQAIRKKLAEK